MGVLVSALQQGLNGVVVPTLYDTWTIEAGKPKKEPGKLLIDPGSRRSGFQNTAAVRDFDWYMQAAAIIDEFSYAESTYANIVRQRLFRQLYQFDTRSLNYINGTTAVQKMEDSFPCQHCGLIIPAEHVSIDHARPQKGGVTESVAKVMRMMGLTVGGAKGAKPVQLKVGVAAAAQNQGGLAHGLQRFQMNSNVQPVLTEPGRGMKAASTQQELIDRYSLNWEGSLLYSLVIALNCVDVLETRCMHSLVNLRPLCGHCNSMRGNPLKF
jgi:hypothetical protein